MDLKSMLVSLILAAGATQATHAKAAAVEELSDHDWIKLTGTVAKVSEEGFTLAYDEGAIVVEMDDLMRNGGNPLETGDHVTVNGRIDQNFYEARTIEASAVFVDRLNTYFNANPVDEEQANNALPSGNRPREGNFVAFTGTVTSVGNESLTLVSGGRSISVDTSEMTRETGASAGDRVSVHGEMDSADFFEGREVVATSVVILSG